MDYNISSTEQRKLHAFIFTLGLVQHLIQIWLCLYHHRNRNSPPKFPILQAHTNTHTHAHTSNEATPSCTVWIRHMTKINFGAKKQDGGKTPRLISLCPVCVFVCVCVRVRVWKAAVVGDCPTTEEVSRKSESIVFLVH